MEAAQLSSGNLFVIVIDKVSSQIRWPSKIILQPKQFSWGVLNAYCKEFQCVKYDIFGSLTNDFTPID